MVTLWLIIAINGSYAMSFLMCYLRLGVLGSPLLAPNCNDLLVDKIVKLLNQKKNLHKNGPKQGADLEEI